MVDSFVYKHIKQSNRTMLLFALLMIALVVGVSAFMNRYLYNFFSGPFQWTGEQVLMTDNANDSREYYIEITGEESIDTGFQYVEVDDSTGDETPLKNYLALVFEDRLLLVETDPDVFEFNGPVVGELVNMSGDIQTDVIAELEAEVPELSGVFLPVMLKTGNFKEGGYVGLFVAALIILGSLYLLWSYFRRSGNVENHPIMRKLARFGPADQVARPIDHEVETQLRQKVDSMYITKGWLIGVVHS